MRDDLPTLRARAARLRRLIKATPVRPEFPEEIGRILRGSPQILEALEKELGTSTPTQRQAMDAFLARLESLLEWTTAQARGTATALDIQAGRAPDPAHPAEARLRQRLTQFLHGELGEGGFLARVREWAGESAVQGRTIHLDPAEVARFSGWLLFDVLLAGDSETAMERFARKSAFSLPPDERSLLERWQKDRPSVYRVQALHPGEGYAAFDVIREEAIRILDRTSARTISTGAFFIGRPAPAPEGGVYGLVEPISEIAPRVWPTFEARLRMLLDRHQASPRARPGGDFFRAHHAELWRYLMTLR